MLKVTIDNEEVLCNKDFTINEEMLNTSSTILNNVYPIEWEEDKDYVSRFYYPKDYSKCKIFDEIYHPETKEEVEGTSFSIEVDKTKQEELLSIKGQTTQDGTPTPSTPQPKNVVSGRQLVSVNNEEYYEINLGKNLININGIYSTSGSSFIRTWEDGVATLTWSAGFTLYLSSDSQRTFTFEPNETYTLSFEHNGNALHLRTDEGNTNRFSTNTDTEYTRYSYTFTGISSLVLKFVRKDNSGTAYLKNFQIEKGSSASGFSPYKIPIELCKIGNYQDYIFRNTTENPLYDSTLEEGQWYIHKEIGRVVLTGASSESWSNQTAQNLTNTLYLRTPIIDGLCKNDIPTLFFSNYFKPVEVLWNNDEEGIQLTTNTPNIRLRINKTTTSTTDNFKTWLSTHNVEVYYVLNTPTNTLIEDEELISQLNSIQLISGLNNVSVSSPYLPGIIKFLYNYAPEYTEEDLYFCGIVKNTGEISLNPRYPHYCNVQVLDFKDFLSQGETLDFVITEKTIGEAIDQVIGTIAPYGFIKGNILLDDIDDTMGTYSTKDKTAYDVFNYIADITQSRWTTRMIDEDTIAIDFYDPNKLPMGTAIDYTNEWFCTHKINDLNYSYSSNDYRNKQVMLSGEVYSNIETTEILVADGYQTQFNTIDKIGKVSSLLLNGTPVSIITKDEYDLGYDADFYYQPGNKYFESVNLVSTGAILTIVYYAIIEGREVILNQDEISRVENMTGRKGVIARYENRNDATTTGELQAIGQSYLEYKGTPEIKLNITSRENTWNIGDRVYFNAPLDELKQTYMVKSKKIQRITTIDEMFYQYELTSSFNMEQDINYFDNQRFKSKGNIGEGEFISRNVDIENTANVIFYNLDVEEVEIEGNSTLQAELQAPLGVE